jgi:hypothetical protein
VGIVCGDFYRFGETLMEVKIDLETLIWENWKVMEYKNWIELEKFGGDVL